MAAIVDLAGKRGLVVGIANSHSIAAGCAAAFRQAGADLAITYLNEKAEPFVRPVAEVLGAPFIMPCAFRVNSMRCSRGSRRIGDGSTFCCIRSPSRRKRTCRPA